MKPHLPQYIAPSRPDDRQRQRRQRQVGKRRLVLAAFLVIVVVVVVALAVASPGSKKASSSTTTTSLGAATTTSATVAPTNTPLTYSAELTGENETPAVSTSASGTLTLTAAADGSSVDYVLKVSGITNLTAARLHEGKAGATGATILTLYDGPTKTGAFSGTLTQGSIATADLVGSLKGKTIADLMALIEAGSVYLNVGTSAHISGEIRGQLQ